jgi:hypothetical protein
MFLQLINWPNDRLTQLNTLGILEKYDYVNLKIFRPSSTFLSILHRNFEGFDITVYTRLLEQLGAYPSGRN